MAHFAKVENGIVKEVLVVDAEFVSTGALGDPKNWIQCSYNTRGNVHYGPNGEPDDGVALRANFPGTGFIYDTEHDVFYAPQANTEYTLNTSTWLWDAPV